MPEFYTVETRHARRQHRCCECGLTIEKGESYQRATGKWEDEIRTYKTCQRCLDLLNFVKAHVPCVCWYFESMREDILAAARDYAEEAPGLLFGAYRREIKIRRNRNENTSAP